MLIQSGWLRQPPSPRRGGEHRCIPCRPTSSPTRTVARGRSGADPCRHLSVRPPVPRRLTPRLTDRCSWRQPADLALGHDQRGETVTIAHDAEHPSRVADARQPRRLPAVRQPPWPTLPLIRGVAVEEHGVAEGQEAVARARRRVRTAGASVGRRTPRSSAAAWCAAGGSSSSTRRRRRAAAGMEEQLGAPRRARPLAAALSRARTVVVPTATTRRAVGDRSPCLPREPGSARCACGASAGRPR